MTRMSSEDPEKHFTHVRVKFGTFDKCCPLCSVVPHSITSSHPRSLWHPLPAGSTSVLRLFFFFFLTVIVFPTRCRHPCLLSSTEVISSHIYLFFFPLSVSLMNHSTYQQSSSTPPDVRHLDKKLICNLLVLHNIIQHLHVSLTPRKVYWDTRALGALDSESQSSEHI